VAADGAPKTHAGRVALVTGGGRGIGAAVAAELAARGARVAVLDADPDLATESARNCGGHAGVCDVADRAAVDRACAEAEEALGPVDILVNNAGISPKRGGKPMPVWEMDGAEWDAVVAVNLTGCFNMARRLSPGMVGRKRSWIVNMASVSGRVWTPLVGGHYTATKTALVGLTRHWAGELGPHGVRVNAVAPGRIATPVAKLTAPETNQAIVAATPLGRPGEPEEVARAVCFLSGPDAEFVSGATLDVSGGWMMS
jgi:3-oxoacyl-[acyl-carrier protein] reductase